MRTIYLHIGQPKTATTTLQSLFSSNRNWLNNRGLLYPHAPKGTFYHGQDAHHFLVDGIRHSLFGWHWNNPSWTPVSAEQAWSEIYEQMEDHPSHDVLISAEGFFMLGYGYLPHIQQSISWLRKRLKGFDLKVICYLRRQDLWLEANYNQVVKSTITSETKTISEWLKADANKRFMDYLSILNVWGNNITEDNIIIKPFEKEQFKNNDIIDDFLDIFGLERDQYMNIPKIENKRLSNPCLEFRRISNTLNTTYEAKEKLGITLQSISDAFETSEKQLMPLELALKVMNNCAGSNDKIAVKYLKRKNGQLFLNEPDNNISNNYSKLSIEDLTLITAALYAELHKDMQPLHVRIENQKKRLDHQRELIDSILTRIEQLE